MNPSNQVPAPPTMLHSLRPWTGLALGLLCAGSVRAQDAALFLGPPGGTGDVRVVNDLGFLPTGQPLALTGIELLPTQFTLHSQLDAWDTSVPQLVPLPGGASSVRIPGHGSLYNFRRPSALGDQFGTFRVALDGSVQVLFEQPGTGLGQSTSPFAPRFAVAPDASAILLATTLAAGGNLLEYELASGTLLDRTPTQAPLDFAPAAGLALTSGFGFAATGTELWSFARQPAASAASLILPTPGGSAVLVPGDFARSADGQQLALVAGEGPDLEYVFVIDAAGLPRRVTDVPAKISPAGYLPDVLHGPFFALSSDGSHVGWRTEGPVSTEGWLRATAPLAPVPMELTGDALFLDTLDEIAPFAFFDPNRLLMGVGEVGGVVLGGIDSVDLFSVTLDSAGQPVFENTTQTSGVTTPPFFAKPAITPVAVRRLPGTQTVLVQDGNLHRLTLAGPGQLPVTIDPVSKKLRFEVAGGGHALLVIERDDPFKDLRFVNLDTALGTWSEVTTLPKEITLDATAARADGWIGVVLTAGPSQWTFGYDLMSGTLEFTLPLPFGAGPTLDLDTNGDLLVSSGPAGSPALFARDPLPGVPSLLSLPPLVGFLLPR